MSGPPSVTFRRAEVSAPAVSELAAGCPGERCGCRVCGEPRAGVQAQKLYRVRALSSTILRASSSGTSTRCSASSLRVCGQLESECGESLSNKIGRAHV